MLFLLEDGEDYMREDIEKLGVFIIKLLFFLINYKELNEFNLNYLGIDDIFI